MNMNNEVKAFENNGLWIQMEFDLKFTALFRNSVNQINPQHYRHQ